MVRLVLGSLLQGKTRQPTLKITHLLLVQQIWDVDSFDVATSDFGTSVQGQARQAKLKSTCNLLATGPPGLGCETNPIEIMGN